MYSVLKKELIKKNHQKTPFDLGNEILYKLCKDYPNHTEIDEIIAKIWIIGRTYAASIERQKDKDNNHLRQTGNNKGCRVRNIAACLIRALRSNLSIFFFQARGPFAKINKKY